ncbi:MAG: hypothetical protein HC925_08745 [Coleofasciculaceae cyanobacterium SM2_3_26]|nr:hypothetical protein [Coleofasciculaceae cyanobacterium SM2_3_26]
MQQDILVGQQVPPPIPINPPARGNQAPQPPNLLVDPLYNLGESIWIPGIVTDEDGYEDVKRVDFWLEHQGVWYNLEDATEFDSYSLDSQEARFGHSLGEQLLSGEYSLWGVAHDFQDAVSAPIRYDFTVLSAPSGQDFSERVKRSLERAVDLENYTAEALSTSFDWIVSIRAGESVAALANQFGAENLGATGHPTQHLCIGNSLRTAPHRKSCKIDFRAGQKSNMPIHWCPLTLS